LEELMANTKTYDPHKSALLIRGVLGIQGIKQTQLARKLGLNRVVVNMFLNRWIDLLQKDIQAIIKELGIEKQAEKMCGLNNEK